MTAACGGSGSAPATVGEPAAASALSEPPAGRVVQVGRNPEGIAVDPVTGLVAVATRAPKAIQVLDADGGPLRSVALPASARHLRFGAEPGLLLAPLEGAGLLASIDVRAGNPTHGHWRTVGSMVSGRNNFELTLLGDGRVLAAGDGGTAELYTPATRTWHATGAPIDNLIGTAMVVEQDGTVLAAGGDYEARRHRALRPFVADVAADRQPAAGPRLEHGDAAPGRQGPGRRR